MFTTGSKWFFGLGTVASVLAVVYGYSTGGDLLGPFTAGYWGGVGDHLGYMVLVSIALAADLLGILSLATRDAGPAALAELAGTEETPDALVPVHGAYWPLVGAFGVSLVVLGLVISNVLFITGFFVLLGVGVEWMVLAWSDRATGDPETNRLVRDRLLAPFEVPLAGFLIVAGTVAAVSRLLLTSSQLGAVAVATVLGVLILALGTVIATRPKLSANTIAAALVVCAVGVVAVGIGSAARGERVIEHHEEEHGGEGEGAEIGPNVPAGTNAIVPAATEEEG